MNKKLNQILKQGWSVPENLSVSDWCKKYITLKSPFGTRYVPELSPWLKEPLEALKDQTVREIVLNCSAQSSKSTYLLMGMAWALSEDSSPALFIAPNEDLAKRYSRQRIHHYWKNVPNLNTYFLRIRARNNYEKYYSRVDN